MTDLQPLPREIECLAYGAIEAEAKRRKTIEKALLGAEYPEGRTQRFTSPLPGRAGGALGSVLRTQGKAEFRIVDRDAFLEHARQFDHAVELVFDVHTPTGSLTGLSEVDELVVVLREHAAHMLVERERVAPEVEKAAIEQSEATGEPAAPGIELVETPGEMRVTPAKGAIDVVARLVQAKLLNWDGSRVLPAASGDVIEAAS